MSEQTQTRLLAFLSGALVGIFLMLGSGLLVYKFLKHRHTPAWYNSASGRPPAKLIEGNTDGRTSHEARFTGASQGSKEGFVVFAASNLDRIFKDGKTLLKPNFTEGVSISLAKNEYESFQVVVQNGKYPLTGVAIEPGDLQCDQTGEKILKENITWNVVGYVPTQKPYYAVKYVGLWPDPLMPPQKTDVTPGEVQPFWITVYVPEETAAGVYNGHIRILSDRFESRELPVSVRVYDFSLAKETHLRTAFDFYDNLVGTRYPQGPRESAEAYKARKTELKDKFIIEMLKHRMNPVLNVNPSSDSDLAKVDRYRWFGLNNFSIGRRGGTFENNWPYDDEALEKLLSDYRTYGETLAINKMLDYHYIYAWDEGKVGNPQVTKVASMIHRAYPKLKNMVCYHGFWEPRKDPAWGKDIDIWCFQISSFNEEKMNALKKMGIEIWMYVSGPDDDGAPNLAIDFDSIDYRIIPWICWKYEIKGFLYWSVIWWPDVDPFVSAANTKWKQNGNGLLMYPGENGPILSLRMAIFRDGAEDYEYLSILKEYLDSFDKKGLSVTHPDPYQKALKFLTVDQDIVHSTQSFTKAGEQLKAHRNALAEAIEELEHVLKGAAATAASSQK